MTTASTIRLPAAYPPPPGHRRPARLNPRHDPLSRSRPLSGHADHPVRHGV